MIIGINIWTQLIFQGDKSISIVPTQFMFSIVHVK